MIIRSNSGLAKGSEADSSFGRYAASSLVLPDNEAGGESFIILARARTRAGGSFIISSLGPVLPLAV